MVIWSILGLYLLITLTFSIPAVQEYLGQRAANVLSEKLGTSVSIGRLKYGLLSHLTLYQVNIKDQRGTDMLIAGRISAHLDVLPLADGKISISTAQLFGAHAKLYQRDSLSKPNFQFVLDSLASKDTTSTSAPLDLRINSLIIRHSTASFDRFDLPKTAGVLNPNHIKITDISSQIILKALSEDSLNINIKRLSFKEQSGLNVKRLSMHFEGGKNSSHLTDFELRMPGTNIKLGNIEAFYRFRGDHFVTPSLHYSGSVQPSTITLSDLACLLPSLNTFQSTLSLSCNFNGEGETLNVPMLAIGSTTGDISINIGGWIKNLRNTQPAWNADIRDLALSAKTVSFISENLQGQRIQVPQELVRMGNIHLRGHAQGNGVSSIETSNQLQTDAGSVNMSMSIDEKRHFNGHINTKDFNLQKILGDEQFGILSTDIGLSGQLPSNQPLIVKADGIVHQFDFKGYNYHHININGLYSPTDIHGHASIDDANIGIVIDGSVLKTGKQHNVKLEATFANLSPKAINLSDMWGEARFYGDVKANFLASNLNDAVGTVDINDFSMQGHNAEYNLDELHLESGYNGNMHFITMTSDFGEAAIRGDFDYETLPQSFTNFFATRMPTISGQSAPSANAHNNFSIQATIRKSDWIEHLLRTPFHLTQPLTLQGGLNDERQQIYVECDIPQFYYDQSRYDNGHINILSPINTLQYEVSVTKHSEEGNGLDLQVMGSVHNDQLAATLQWNDQSEEETSGRITTMTRFEDAFDGTQAAIVKIAHSQMSIKDTPWQVLPSTIIYSNKKVNIADFTVSNDQQYLKLNGTVSENPHDSITVNMRDIDISYILDLVGFDAVSFSGKATGGGVLRGVLGELEADAKLLVKGFEFEHGRMGTLDANINWNKDKEQIDIKAIADDGDNSKTFIDGYVSPKLNQIDLDISAKGTRLDFAQSFTSTFLDHIDGNANGAIKLAGPLNAMNLYGYLVLNGKAHVSVLNCTYELRNDSLELTKNEIKFKNCRLYDTYGNEGIMTGGIHHNDLTDLTYDIFLDAKNLLSYDFKSFGDASFYGTVFADGNVAIYGRENSLLIEADVTPKRGTEFVYNAANSNAITDQEFIVWSSKDDSPKPKYQSTALDSYATTDYFDVSHNDLRTDINMRLKINATPDATIRLLMDENTNDYITLRGTGDLQTTFYNKGSFNMFGTYRISEGTYGITIQNIIKKNFIFKEGGTITFGGDPYDARLNMQAQHTVNGVSLSDLNVGKSFANTVRVNCLMDISGQPSAPIIEFDLDIPNVNSDEKQMLRSIINSEEEMNQQVLYLLAVGRFYPQGANNANDEETGGKSKTSLAMQSLLSGTLSSQLNDMLNRVIKSNNWSFGANISTGDEGWDNAEYEGIVNGRLLNNRLLINGQFGYRDGSNASSKNAAAAANSSFIGDFDIRYLLLPNGNLAVKVYNQTNDRYFTKSSLNTQGIGIIMQKEFNGLGELLSTKKKKSKKVKKP